MDERKTSRKRGNMIAIKMDMPTHCGGCKFYIWDYLERNGICLCNNYKHVDLHARDKDCPLILVEVEE